MNEFANKISEFKNKFVETQKKINEIRFDAHWYRRVFHTFGASFIWYYTLPNMGWVNLLKTIIPILIVSALLVIEILRIKGKIGLNHFFGLRMYEKNRIGSYLFFGIGILILLLFFPQQIAIPCILCACIADPILGEIRTKFNEKTVYLTGFILCMSIFALTWYKTNLIFTLLISLIGGAGAVIGEMKKFWWLDDDIMIQILPAIMIAATVASIQFFFHINILPEQLIYPGEIPKWMM